jgi:hypothetical protein
VRIVADELESLWQSKSISNGQRLTDNEGVRLSDGEKKGTGEIRRSSGRSFYLKKGQSKDEHCSH